MVSVLFEIRKWSHHNRGWTSLNSPLADTQNQIILALYYISPLRTVRLHSNFIRKIKDEFRYQLSRAPGYARSGRFSVEYGMHSK
jgi:hypothetical protein